MSYFTTENIVRLRRGYYVDEVLSGEDAVGSTIYLEKNTHYIMEVVKNGDLNNPLVEGTDFDFKPPHDIELAVAGVSGNWFGFVCATELIPQALQSIIGQGTGIVEGYLEALYGTYFETWKTLDGVPTRFETGGNPQAPALINGLTADLSGCMGDMSMMRKSHEWDPDVQMGLHREKTRLYKRVEDIAQGKVLIPGITTESLISRGMGNEGAVWGEELTNVGHIDHFTEDERLGVRGGRHEASFGRWRRSR